MTDPLLPDQLEETKSKWVWFSTRDTIAKGIFSVTATIETIIAAPLYWWVAIHFETWWPLIFSACIAPLVLMRSGESVALGVKWFDGFMSKRINPNNSRKIFFVQFYLLVFFLILLIIYIILFNINYIPNNFIITSKIFNILGFILIIFSALFFIIVGIITILFINPTEILKTSFIWSRNQESPTHLYYVPYFIGLGIGTFIIVMFFRIFSTLRCFFFGFPKISQNFYKLLICTSPIQMSEFLPGLQDDSDFTLALWMTRIRMEFKKLKYRVDILNGLSAIIIAIIWFLPAWLYRFTLKSTAWAWWPLAIIGSELSLSLDLRWEYEKQFKTIFGKISFAVNFIAIIIFIFTNLVLNISVGEIPTNPFLTPFGYAFSIDFSGRFWPSFVFICCVLNISFMIWIDHTYRKHRSAIKTNNTILIQEVQNTLSWMEIVKRVRNVLAIIYCFFIIIQAMLYANSQKCWFIPPEIVQNKFDLLYGDKSPRTRCDVRTQVTLSPTKLQ